VRLLFVGESPPASGRFFYAATSGLYRAIRRTFISALPALEDTDFLESFCAMECYLVDLCGKPVDRLSPTERRQACAEGEIRLSRTIEEMRPEVVVTIVRSISENVRRALEAAGWEGKYLELPYPGRWQRHRQTFTKTLAPILKRRYRGKL
jgi:hypothetical protein